jgi:DNA polymerase II small subunit/DNA polymerase delta subunit B
VQCTGRLYPPEYIPGTHFCYRLSRPQPHIAAGRIKSMKNLEPVTLQLVVLCLNQMLTSQNLLKFVLNSAGRHAAA